MIQFSTMGELQYIERYKIDKSTKLIAEFVAGIKNIKNKKAFLPVDDFDIFPIFEKSSLLFSLDIDCVKYVKTHYVATEHNGFHFIEIQIIYLLLDFLLVRQLLMDKLSLCR